MMWTIFWDMNSGGHQKLPASKIYIHAPQEEAIEIFKKTFGRNPYNVTCTCCGEDYVVEEYESLEHASAFHRNCEFQNTDVDGNHITTREWHTLPKEKRGDGRWLESPGSISLDEYRKDPNVMIIDSTGRSL